MRSLIVAAVLALLSCASSPPPPPPPNPQPTTTPGTTQEEMNASVMIDVKKTVAAELNCPIDQVNLRCTAHDSHGGCIAVQGRGCDKTMEYAFGGEP